MAEKIDPKTHRLIQTSEGVVGVPNEQKGVPIKEYFRNAEMPQDLSQAVVYATQNGPIVAEPDLVPWNEQHTVKANNMASKVKEIIDERGYYSKVLNSYAKKLSHGTDLSQDQTKAVISQSFEKQFGQTPHHYLQDHRRSQGLPVQEHNKASRSHSNNQTMEQ